MYYQSNRQTKKKKRRTALGFSIFSGFAVLIVIVSTSLLIGFLAPSSNRVVEENDMLERVDNPFSCPTFEFSHDPGMQEFGGICIAWYNETTLYYWKFVSGTGEMRALTYDANRTNVLSVSEDFFGGTYSRGAFLDCTYYPANNTFLLVTDNNELDIYSPDGTLVYTVEMTLEFDPESGSDPTTTSLFFDENGQFYIDDTYGNGRQPSVYRPLNVETGVIGTAIETSYELGGNFIERYTGLERNLMDNKVYGLALFVEPFDPPSIIGSLNLETNQLEPVCVGPTAGTSLVSISFDTDGVAWVATGGKAETPFLQQAIYKLSGPFFPQNTTESTTFSLQCTESIIDVIGSTRQYPAPDAVLVGSGCLDSQVRVFSANQSVNVEDPALNRILTRDLIYDEFYKESLRNEAPAAVYHEHVENITYIPDAWEEEEKRKRSVSYTLDSIREGIALTNSAANQPTTGPVELSAPFVFLENGDSVNGLIVLPFSFSGSDSQRITLYSNVTQLDNGIAQTIDISTTFSGDCATTTAFDNQRVARADNEANRFIIGWTVNSRSKLCVAITMDNTLSGFDLYEFDFTGQVMEKLSLSVWGDYYTMCFNDANSNDANCFVLERERMLNPMIGMPRILPVPAFAIVSAGSRATADPLNQPNNNGPRGPLMAAFPCGVFATITADMGGVVNLKLCQSIDFGTSMLISMDSLTTIGTYDNGTGGTCLSETRCISIGSQNQDPNRYDIMTAYRHFPFLNGLEQFAFTITVNANGLQNSAILVGRFDIDVTGALSGNVQTFDPNVNNQWNPSPVLTPDAILWIGFKTYTPGGIFINWQFTRQLYNTTTFGPPIQALVLRIRNSDVVQSTENYYLSAWPGFNSTIHAFRPASLEITPTQFNVNVVRWLRFTSPIQRYARKFWAYDDCNQVSTCTTFVEFSSPRNYTLPPPSA